MVSALFEIVESPKAIGKVSTSSRGVFIQSIQGVEREKPA
jgi:hypothetical protein